MARGSGPEKVRGRGQLSVRMLSRPANASLGLGLNLRE